MTPAGEVADLLKRLAPLFQSARAYGSDVIIRRHLGLPDDEVLPLTIPHGVDTYMLWGALDVATFEPLYLAWREDIAARAARFKAVLRFPHPWLLMTPDDATPDADGTLFLSPPPSETGFESLWTAMQRGDYPKPWGVLVKARGATPTDFEWWQARGVAAHTAGPATDPQFYYNLRRAFAPYGNVASVNMSSAVVFAAAAGKRVAAVPDVSLELLDIETWTEIVDLDDIDGRIRQGWSRLLSADAAISLAQAREFLGYRFLDSADRLAERYRRAVASLRSPIHLHPLGPESSRLLARAIAAGFPAHRLFPNPARRLRGLLRRTIGKERLCVITGSDFAHYRIAGTSGPLDVRLALSTQLGASAQPGSAVRPRATR